MSEGPVAIEGRVLFAAGGVEHSLIELQPQGATDAPRLKLRICDKLFVSQLDHLFFERLARLFDCGHPGAPLQRSIYEEPDGLPPEYRLAGGTVREPLSIIGEQRGSRVAHYVHNYGIRVHPEDLSYSKDVVETLFAPNGHSVRLREKMLVCLFER